MDIVSQVVLQLATVMAAVWGITNALHSVAKRRWGKDLSKPVTALVLGPVFGVIAFVLGYLSAVPVQEGWKGIGGAAFAGLVAVGASNVFAGLIKAGKGLLPKK